MVILHLNRYSIWRAPVAGAAAVSAAILHCLGIGLRLFASLSGFLLLLLRCASCSCRSRCVLCGRGRLGCGACTYSLLPGSEPDGVGGLPHVRARERGDAAAAGGRDGVDRLRGPRDQGCAAKASGAATVFPLPLRPCALLRRPYRNVCTILNVLSKSWRDHDNRKSSSSIADLSFVGNRCHPQNSMGITSYERRQSGNALSSPLDILCAETSESAPVANTRGVFESTLAPSLPQQLLCESLLSCPVLLSLPNSPGPAESRPDGQTLSRFGVPNWSRL